MNNSHTSTDSTANRSPEPAGNREDHMATLAADFNFAASMISWTGKISWKFTPVYLGHPGACNWIHQNNPKLWPEFSAEFSADLHRPRHKLGSKSTSRSHGSTPAGWPRWIFSAARLQSGHWFLKHDVEIQLSGAIFQGSVMIIMGMLVSLWTEFGFRLLPCFLHWGSNKWEEETRCPGKRKRLFYNGKKYDYDIYII